ncbi:hypothetical protein Hanom_Chr15g01360941 [Helianthus anomalus]
MLRSWSFVKDSRILRASCVVRVCDGGGEVPSSPVNWPPVSVFRFFETSIDLHV